MKHPSACYLCKGTGLVDDLRCTHCDGMGIPTGVPYQPNAEPIGELIVVEAGDIGFGDGGPVCTCGVGKGVHFEHCEVYQQAPPFRLSTLDTGIASGDQDQLTIVIDGATICSFDRKFLPDVRRIVNAADLDGEETIPC